MRITHIRTCTYTSTFTCAYSTMHASLASWPRLLVGTYMRGLYLMRSRFLLEGAYARPNHRCPEVRKASLALFRCTLPCRLLPCFLTWTGDAGPSSRVEVASLKRGPITGRSCLLRLGESGSEISLSLSPSRPPLEELPVRRRACLREEGPPSRPQAAALAWLQALPPRELLLAVSARFCFLSPGFLPRQNSRPAWMKLWRTLD